jgi:hypothetical protein
VSRLWKGVAGRLSRLTSAGAPRVPRQAAPRQAAPPRRPARPSTIPVSGRRLVYRPQPDGQADPGEVVWTWVAYEDEPTEGKDRPVLVVGREGNVLLGLMLSSQSERAGQRHWMALGPGAWDRQARPSWIRLDRVLEVVEDGIRREGAVLDRRRFDAVATVLRAQYGWG